MRSWLALRLVTYRFHRQADTGTVSQSVRQSEGHKLKLCNLNLPCLFFSFCCCFCFFRVDNFSKNENITPDTVLVLGRIQSLFVGLSNVIPRITFCYFLVKYEGKQTNEEDKLSAHATDNVEHG